MFPIGVIVFSMHQNHYVDGVVMMLDTLLQRLLQLPRHSDPKPGSSMPQMEQRDTPGGMRAMGGIANDMKRHPYHSHHQRSETNNLFFASGYHHFAMLASWGPRRVDVPTKPLSCRNHLGTIHLHYQMLNLDGVL